MLKMDKISGANRIEETSGEYSLDRNLDQALRNWYLISSWYPISTILLFYFLCVFQVGPRWMARRQPYQLTYILRLYNIIQVVYNWTIFIQLMTQPNSLAIIGRGSCSNITKKEVGAVGTTFISFIQHYMILKFLDLVDTVFLVLRKKDSRKTFLHVYHHVSMVCLVWFCFRYYKSFHGIFLALPNVFVHGVMYSYYFLATFPALKGCLWWKSHVTKLQLMHQLVNIAYLLAVYFSGCPISDAFAYIWMFNISLLFLLFLDFYIKTYSSESTTSVRSGEAIKLS